MKKVEIILDENIGINVEEDLTISDVIKSMAMLGAVMKLYKHQKKLKQLIKKKKLNQNHNNCYGPF